MRNILIMGAGTIGSLVAVLLSDTGRRGVHLADSDAERAQRAAEIAGKETPVNGIRLSAEDEPGLAACLRDREIDALVSALPYYCNPALARAARRAEVAYFDLTEDVRVAHEIRGIAQGSRRPFIPQCGIAPGFVSIVAQDLINRFDGCETVKMRVGALPVHPSNALKYSLTWSTDGLINEYGNPCQGIVNGEMVSLQPLEGLETIEIDGLLYEAFHTSGGLGTLAETCAGKVETMDYKTIRYPGHCEKIRLLMMDLKLNRDRPTLKRILENAVPRTLQDVVIIYVAVAGRRDGDFFTENYVRKIYPAAIKGRTWSAIQIATASGLCATLEHALEHPETYRGFCKLEDFPLSDILANPFGEAFR